MRKNKMMRTAAVLGVATMLTASVISGTFAKYTTSTSGSDSARVAKWGFDKKSEIELKDLFKDAYDTTVKSTTDVIAPGTKGQATFGFSYDKKNDNVTAPEVAYTFEVSTEGSSCDQNIQNNPNIVWSLDGALAPAVTEGTTAEAGTWTALLAAIEDLDGNKTDNKYAPGELPVAFNATGNNEHTVSWEWKYESSTAEEGVADKNQDITDTNMGNADTLANVTLKIAITATQVD